MLQRLFDSPWQLLILVLVIVVVFGWKKLPDAARSLGRSMRIFKSEVEQMGHDKDSRSAASSDTVEGRVADEAATQAPPGAAQQSPAAPGAGKDSPPWGDGTAAQGGEPAPERTAPQSPSAAPTAQRDQQPHHHG